MINDRDLNILNNNFSVLFQFVLHKAKGQKEFGQPIFAGYFITKECETESRMFKIFQSTLEICFTDFKLLTLLKI